MRKLIALTLLTCLFIAAQAGSLQAQQQLPGDTAQAERDALHLNTIGAFSAGFVLQSYGYIGVLADALSRGVYEADLVAPMLTETTSYLRNVNAQLQKYPAGSLTSADQKFISSMMEIIKQLIAEAEALASFAKTKSKEDLEKYETARKTAWKNIEKTFGMKK